MTEIFTAPIFPTGVIAIADADRKYSEDFDRNNFELLLMLIQLSVMNSFLCFSFIVSFRN